MKTKKITAAILGAFMLASLSTAASAATFTDVPETHPYKVEIDFCEGEGFIKGTGGDTFMPDAKLTRGQLAAIWCRSLNLAGHRLKDINHSFTDITKLKAFYDMPAIVLYSLGFMSGSTETRFAPDEYVTREQIASITMRSYNLGVADPEAYRQYDDHALISTWARDGISACLNADVFEGLYEGVDFKPNEPVTRGEICKLVYNLSLEAHDVTIGTLEGGTITVSRTKARLGTIITVTVNPDEGKQLKAGTLKYNDVAIEGNSFAMPGEDVTITAEFEDMPVVLESIAVTTPPTKTTYTAGENLDLSGLVITATYSDDSTAAVTGYTTDPDDGSALETAGATTVTVSFAAEGVTKTVTFTVEVTAADGNGNGE